MDVLEFLLLVVQHDRTHGLRQVVDNENLNRDVLQIIGSDPVALPILTDVFVGQKFRKSIVRREPESGLFDLLIEETEPASYSGLLVENPEPLRELCIEVKTWGRYDQAQIDRQVRHITRQEGRYGAAVLLAPPSFSRSSQDLLSRSNQQIRKVPACMLLGALNLIAQRRGVAPKIVELAAHYREALSQHRLRLVRENPRWRDRDCPDEPAVNSVEYQ